MTTSEEGLLALATSRGIFPVDPEIHVPAYVEQIRVEADGTVKALEKGEDDLVMLGTLECWVFMYGWESTNRLTDPFTVDLPASSLEFGLDSKGRGSIVLSGWRSVD